jgi:hypothetical protein
VPPTGQRPPTERERRLEELREESARLGETVIERAAELIRMRAEVAAAKKKALEREANWLKFLEWRKKQDECFLPFSLSEVVEILSTPLPSRSTPPTSPSGRGN